MPSCCPFQFRIRQEVLRAGRGRVGRGGAGQLLLVWAGGLSSPCVGQRPWVGGTQPLTFHSLLQPQTPSSPPHPAPPGWGGDSHGSFLTPPRECFILATGGSRRKWPTCAPPPSKVASHLETESVWEHLQGIPWV